MSRHLRDSADRNFQMVLSLIENGKTEKALKKLKEADEIAKLLLQNPGNEFFQENLPTSFKRVSTL